MVQVDRVLGLLVSFGSMAPPRWRMCMLSEKQIGKAFSHGVHFSFKIFFWINADDQSLSGNTLVYFFNIHTKFQGRMAYLTGDLVVFFSEKLPYGTISFDFLWLGLRELQISVFDSRFLLLSPMVREKLWKETISTNYGGKWRLKQLDSHIPEHTYTWYYCIRGPPPWVWPPYFSTSLTFFDGPKM